MTPLSMRRRGTPVCSFNIQANKFTYLVLDSHSFQDPVVVWRKQTSLSYATPTSIFLNSLQSFNQCILPTLLQLCHLLLFLTHSWMAPKQMTLAARSLHNKHVLELLPCGRRISAGTWWRRLWPTQAGLVPTSYKPTLPEVFQQLLKPLGLNLDFISLTLYHNG